jgi:hypothetical protein
MRPAEPCSISVAATQQLLTQAHHGASWRIICINLHQNPIKAQSKLIFSAVFTQMMQTWHEKCFRVTLLPWWKKSVDSVDKQRYIKKGRRLSKLQHVFGRFQKRKSIGSNLHKKKTCGLTPCDFPRCS